MSTPKNVAKNVAAALLGFHLPRPDPAEPFLWTPLRYPVAWADWPDQVPLWDPAVGQPASVYFDEVPFSVDESPGAGKFHTKQPGIATTISSRWAVEGEQIFWQAPFDLPQQPPAYSEREYPRLVKAYVNRPFALPKQPSSKRLINGLLYLAKQLDPVFDAPEKLKGLTLPGSRFRQEVLQLAELYGPPTRPARHTLWEWVTAALTVQAHVKAFKWLEESGIEALAQKVSAMNARQPGTPSGFQVLYAAPGSDHHQKHPLWINTWLQLQPLQPYQEGDSERPRETSEDEYRQQVIARLVFLFSSSTIGRMYLNGLQVTFTVGALEWAYYMLAQMWAGGHAVKACQGCGAYFLPTRADGVYCSSVSKRSTCRSNKHKRDARSGV